MSRQVESPRPTDTDVPAEIEPSGEWDVEAAFVEHEGKLLRYVGHLLGSRGSEAEDIVQEAFLRLHTQVHVKRKGDQIRNVSVWLFRVAHNLAMDSGRKTTRHKKLKGKVVQKVQQISEDDQMSVDALGQLARAEACRRAMEQLASLPESQRSVVALKVIEGMTFKQIAEVTGTSASGACVKLRDAMQTLSSRLKREGVI